ncbi:tetratricopeptide repeat protein [Psychroflexus sp. S27]|uniref:type IX secretion system periplasmic lipoprotein PorW/SprE n=1 Tax=Psychroflexus sp. S27 TaxID=1982757 RepID=UPI001EDE6AF1|nr:tetratricopeptide repeat protein [Psychroflexus sp. S27]
MNRNFHAMGTYYNILYNGNIALKEGQEELHDSYQEDYWKILPIERMQVLPDQERLNDENRNENFIRAEEKATKSIQKHSMYVGGKEYNPQMDEAFLLLGKSRYFDQRFIPAKDAFSFILNHYPKSSTVNEVKIWNEKANMRLGYYQEAVENLENLVNTKEMDDEVRVLALTSLAEVYLEIDEISQTIPTIDEAIGLTKDNALKGRLYFIKGQVYQELNQKDSAHLAFEKIIELNRKTPRTYRIHAFLEQKKTESYENLAYDETDLFFNELIEDRENRSFLDFIHYERAAYLNQLDSIDLAVESYNASLKESSEDPYLKAQAYKDLGDIYFNRASYLTSGKYYDSTLTNLTERTREKIRIQKKRENLDDVIKYEAIANKNDSILYLVDASENERLAYFEKHVDSLKEEAKSVFTSDKALKIGQGFKQRSSRAPVQGASVFYNENLKQRAYKQFTKTWGELKLADNWRMKPQKSNDAIAQGADSDVDPMEEEFKSPKYDPETYISQIPTEQKVIDSISDDRNFAYYQLGIIYKEKFKRYDLATDKLESVLKQNPEERLILPSKFYLYKIYQDTGESSKELKWKNDILQNHPESNYAKIIRNPEAFASDANNPQNIYYQTYKKYESGDYTSVIAECNAYSAQFTGTNIAPKFELLKAKAIGRVDGMKAYKKALNYVALTYPQSKEGKYAQDRYNQLDQKVAKAEFTDEAEAEEFKLVFEIIADVNVDELNEMIKNEIQEMGYGFNLTKDAYSNNLTFLIVHGLNSKLGGQGLAKKLVEKLEELNSTSYFIASSHNYRVIQIYKMNEEFKNK